MLRRLCLPTLLSFLLTFPAPAQQQDDTPHFPLRDSVVVVASRYSSPLSRETNALTVISGATIQRSADHSLLEAVHWEVPSAFLADTRVGGFGVGTAGTGMLSLRGMGGKPNTGVAVMVDGHPDFMGIFGHPLPDVYGMDDVERVDVLLGPASTVFGGNALGGVVNIVSRSAQRNSVRISAEGGSFGTWGSSIGVSRALGAHGLQLSFAHNRSEGHVPQADFTGSRVQAGWDWRISPQWQLSMRGRYVPYSFDDPTRTSDPAGLGTYGEIRRGMGQIILRNSGKTLDGSTQVHLNMGHHEFFDGFVSDDRSLGLSTYQQWRAGERLSVAAGADLMQYGGTASIDNTEHLLETAGAYALAMYSPLDFLHLRAGMRWQYHSLELAGLSPTFGVSVVPFGGLRVYASMQSGYRHPTLRELYLFPISNPDLTQERSTGYEAGLEYALPRGSFRFAAFRTHALDMIAAVANPAAPPPLRFRNAVEAEQWGLEASLRYRILPFLQTQLAWNRLDPDGLTAFNPAQQFKYMFFADAGALRATVAGQYVHGLFAGDNATLPMPDYHLLDVTLSWRLPWIELYGKARNVLDRRYAILPGYSAPGAHFLLGIRYALED
jgi:outer membrane cobalamin receptor